MADSDGASLMTALLTEIQALRLELADLRRQLEASRASAPAASSIAAAAPAATLLQRRNAERLAAEVQRRQALQADGAADAEPDTELDLLIDRLHDLALDNGG
jgi:hypothetical protein